MYKKTFKTDYFSIAKIVTLCYNKKHKRNTIKGGLKLEYEWKINTPSLEDLGECLSTNPLMSVALYNRGIPLEEARDIVAEPYKGLTKPLNLMNINHAAALIKEFIDKRNGKICIFADYDADGITSAAIAVQCLNYFHAFFKPDEDWMAYCHVPEREDGYGITVEWCQRLVDAIPEEANNILVLTVDNGITKKPAIDILLENGFSALVTDHHRPDNENHATPTCICVDPLNDPSEIGCRLAGCGVIFNIMRHFENLYMNGDHTMTDKCIYLMAIGTIGDMMKMDYYHGCVVSWALQLINSNDCPEWLSELLALQKIEFVTSKTIGFSIAPFLNACGQAGNANLALDIILEPDVMVREDLMREAFKLYNEVKDITKKEKAKAEEAIVELGLDKHSVIIYGVETDFPGIVGKIAYHLSELTNKPAICYRKMEDPIIKGSSRNVNETIPFYDILKDAQRKGIIIAANGHSHALGCEFLEERLDELVQFVDDQIGSMIRTGKSTFMYKREVFVDKIITPDEITMQNVKAIECFPFAKNWPEPSVCIMDAELVKVSASNNNAKNICYTIHNSKGKDVEFWAWNIRPGSYDESKHTKISLIGTLSRDFRNEKKAAFNVVDFKLA